MARDYGRIRAAFWADDKIRVLEPTAKFVALYLLTSPHSNAIGCFTLPTAYASHDTGMASVAFHEALDALEELGIARSCGQSSYIWIPNYIRHNMPENPNVWRKCVKELQSLPRDLFCIPKIAKELLEASFDSRMRTLSSDERAVVERLSNGFETVSETVSKGCAPILSEPNRTESVKPADAGQHSKTHSYSEEFERFWKAYPTDKNMPKKPAFRQWQRLTPEKRQAAIAAIPGFTRYCDENKSWYRPVYAERFLSQEKFEGYAAEPPPANTLEQLREARETAVRLGVPTNRLDRAIEEAEARAA